MKYVDSVIAWHQLTNIDRRDTNIERFVKFTLDMEETSSKAAKLAIMARYYIGGAVFNAMHYSTHAAMIGAYGCLAPVMILLEQGLKAA
ncbi:hypothetical protein VPHD479_0055 [Vibrio phage D479]